MAAITGSGNSEYVIRWTESAARRFNASWSAINVQSLSHPMDTADTARNLALAQQSGAEIIQVPGNDVAACIIRNALIKKANLLVIGKTESNSRSFKNQPNLMEQILERSRELDVIVLQGKNPPSEHWHPRRVHKSRESARGYLQAAALLAGITLLGALAQPMLGYRSVSILYLLAIICLPFVASRTVVFSSALLSALLWNYLFIPPRLTFSIASLEDFLMFAAFFLAAFVGGFLTTRLKEKEKALLVRERRMSLLYGFTREIAQLRGADAITKFWTTYLSEQLNLSTVVLLPDATGKIGSDAGHPNQGESQAQVRIDHAAVATCFAGGQAKEDTHAALYLPLIAAANLGVVYIRDNKNTGIHGETRELLAALADNLALAIERELLTQENDRIRMAGESSRLSKILLNHVSHELRTPLTTIKGAASGLLDGSNADDPVLRSDLLKETLSAANKLNMIVEDLLAMSRLETGKLNIHKELVYIGELIGATACMSDPDTITNRIVLEESVRDFEIMVDPTLMVQVFNNLIRNFLEYTPPSSRLRVSVTPTSHAVSLIFADDGPGVPESELGTIFDTFFRGTAGQLRQGCGLGLSICRGIVELHGGTIGAENRPGGGLSITLELPEGRAHDPSPGN